MGWPECARRKSVPPEAPRPSTMRSAPSSSAPRAPRPVAAMLAALLLLSAGAGTAGPVLPVLRRAERDRAPGTAPAARGRAAGRFDVLFLGSGVSTGVPRIGCIVRPDQSQPPCKVCHDALREGSRNRRGNVSILLRYWHADGRPRHIMVDAGKTMREQCMRLLPRHGIRTLDALLLTHAHADAIHGLDDIRDFQQQGTRHLSWLPPLPCYASAKTFEEIKRRFGYLVPGAGSELEKETAATTANATMVRTVSKLDWHVIPETLATDGASAAGSRAGMTAGNGPQGGGADSGSYAPFDVKGCDGLQVTALPVSAYRPCLPPGRNGRNGRCRRACTPRHMPAGHACAMRSQAHRKHVTTGSRAGDSRRRACQPRF